MVNEEKIRLMAKAASFEKGEGKKALSVNKYFRGDYIGLNLIGGWFCYTVAFAICLGLWALYKMDFLMDNINQLDLPALGRGLVLLYAALLGIFLVINYVVYHLRYRRYKKGLAVYGRILKKLSHMYGPEEDGDGAKAGGNGEYEDFT